MKGLALETVVQWIILLVAAAVIINLLLFFSNDIKRYLENWMSTKKNPKTEEMNSTTFSTGEIMAYMRGCWDKTGEKYEGDLICYILRGDMSNVDANSLKDAVSPPAVTDVSRFDKTKAFATIIFEDIGNKIVLS